MKLISSNTRTASVYIMITIDIERFSFDDVCLENIETIADKLFDNGYGVKCKICDIIKTTVEKWKSHNESTKCEIFLKQSRSKEKKQE